MNLQTRKQSYKSYFLVGGYIMAYIINDECISCGACEGECPVSCISQGDTQFNIDGSECIDCGSCADVCPVSAISPE